MTNLHLERLGYQYPASPSPVLGDLTADLRGRRVVAVAGPSGCGKSTLARLLTGLLPGFRGGRRQGDVYLDGAPLPHFPSGMVGLVMQDAEAQMAGVRAGEEIAAALRASRMSASAAEAIFAALGVEPLRTRRIQGLSGGELRRLALAVTLARGPRCIVLDEPTANLDPDGGAVLKRTVSRLLEVWDGVLLVIEHRPEGPVELADTTLWLDPGGGYRLEDGNPCEVLREALVRSYGSRSGGGGRGGTLLSLRDLGGGYRKGAMLRHVDLDVGEAEIIGIRGANGAGKSTLLAMIAGALRPTEGAMHWRGERTGRRLPVREMGVLLQNPLHQLFCDSVRNEVVLSPRNHGLADLDDAVGDVMAAADLQDLADRPTLALSYGQQQRVALAAALAHKPALVLLDEPTHGMDAIHMSAMLRLVRERRDAGASFLIASHDHTLLESACDRVVTIAEGTLRHE